MFMIDGQHYQVLSQSLVGETNTHPLSSPSPTPTPRSKIQVSLKWQTERYISKTHISCLVIFPVRTFRCMVVRKLQEEKNRKKNIRRNLERAYDTPTQPSPLNDHDTLQNTRNNKDYSTYRAGIIWLRTIIGTVSDHSPPSPLLLWIGPLVVKV